ncbi:reverse transcriptase domain-containing protein [Streptomyces sp. NPDC048384]|uniref:reverse transcriptase domain-containing protein n=1 Tax=Streptomyces sp. NPDC048384 TaxID=3155487 RepID=UPI0034446E33
MDGLTTVNVEREIGPYGFLEDLRYALKSGEFRPLQVRERKIPKPGGSGKVRRLGIPTITDRVVQAALMLVLEPIFEAEFKPVSYGFRPLRRAHDAIAEIHFYGTHGYRWVLDADIEACFDSIDHTALMDRVRDWVKDKRMLRLVKAFLRAGVLTEDNSREDTLTGTPQGGILSPLLANIALSALDEHLARPWEPGREMATSHLRRRRRATGHPNWRSIRYADDLVVLTHGERDDVGALREDIAELQQLGLRLSEAKRQVVHMSEGFDFLGFRIQWHRKRGTDSGGHGPRATAPLAAECSAVRGTPQSAGRQLPCKAWQLTGRAAACPRSSPRVPVAGRCRAVACGAASATLPVGAGYSGSYLLDGG